MYPCLDIEKQLFRPALQLQQGQQHQQQQQLQLQGSSLASRHSSRNNSLTASLSSGEGPNGQGSRRTSAYSGQFIAGELLLLLLLLLLLSLLVRLEARHVEYPYTS